MGRRGFFAEIQHQNQQAARAREREQKAQHRAHTAAVREMDRAQRQAERAAAAAVRASAAEQKAAEKEAKRLHQEAQLAEVEALNAQLAELDDELSSILAATLDVDDYVDLETLRVVADHPPFPRTDLEVMTPEVTPLESPPEPVFCEPAPPKGLGTIFGGKKKHAAAVESARLAFDQQHQAWQADLASLPAREQEQMRQREEAEQRRLAELKAARDAYESECQLRELETADANQQLDALIAGLAVGEHEAVTQYVGIVLGNAVYPEWLEVEHDYEFDLATSELALTVLIARPDSLPGEKAYKYVKAKDEIAATALSKKAQKDRYASVVHQVALRVLHEIFEADRARTIQTITLQVATEARDPATGSEQRVVFAGVAAERQAFLEFDLRNVIPSATLEHLGAALSKNPFELVGIDSVPGVRAT